MSKDAVKKDGPSDTRWSDGMESNVFNYGSIRWLLDDFSQYNGKEFPGSEDGRLQAVDALVHLMNRYHRNKGYFITKDFIVTADYSPKMLPKRYDYGIVYRMKFILNIDGKPYRDIDDIVWNGDSLIVRTKDVSFAFNVKKEHLVFDA